MSALSEAQKVSRQKGTSRAPSATRKLSWSIGKRPGQNHCPNVGTVKCRLINRGPGISCRQSSSLLSELRDMTIPVCKTQAIGFPRTSLHPKTARGKAVGFDIVFSLSLRTDDSLRHGHLGHVQLSAGLGQAVAANVQGFSHVREFR